METILWIIGFALFLTVCFPEDFGEWVGKVRNGYDKARGLGKDERS